MDVIRERLPSDERRSQILDSALGILFRSGSYYLTIRNIAREIGLSEAAIYRHFSNKEELIDCLTELACQTELLQPREKDPLLMLEEIMQQQMQKLSRTPELTAVVFQEELFREYPDVGRKLAKHRSEKEALIVHIVESGQEQGLIDPKVDPAVFALIFMGSVRMAVLKWKEQNFNYSLPNEAKRIMIELKRFLGGECV